MQVNSRKPGPKVMVCKVNRCWSCNYSSFTIEVKFTDYRESALCVYIEGLQ